MTRLVGWMVVLVGALVAGPVLAQPAAAELLKKYDAVMGPTNFEAMSLMTSSREDGSQRTYKMKILKSGDDRFRAWFHEPAAVRGQEMLRQGDNLWVYMPNLKRAVRLANRDSFQGGDFNNADVLRVNYTADYTGTVQADAATPDAWLLELKAKSSSAAYDRIKLWLRKSDSQPIKGEYYTSSGKMLRSAEFSDYKDFGGLKRPAKVMMRNMLVPKRFSVMVMESLNTKVAPAATRFTLDDLGR